MKNTPRIPLVIVSCVAFALAACDQKSAATDPAKDKQMQDMQAKIDALSAQSAELNKQIADRAAAEMEAKRVQLEKDQADVEKQRAQLEADRKALAETPPASQTLAENVGNSDKATSNDDAEPVYKGKPATYDLFYSKLQDDGNWIDSDEYGYIWRPSVAARNDHWRPYSDGRWVETDRGWTWDSNERFGWATYHYGRWVNLNNSGWCWVPGNEWAPAWVSWRSNDRYVGWAPLPPEARISDGGSITASVDVGYDTGPGSYNFVDTQDFGEETYAGRLVSREQNITIINQTVNVTNITYNNRVIHNYGPDYDAISRRSHRPINRYQLALEHNAQFDRDATVPRPRGDRLAIVAPILVASSRGDSNVRPVKVEKKIIKSDRDNGWKGVNPEQRQAVKVDLAKQVDRQTQDRQAQSEQQRLLKARQEAKAKHEQAAAAQNQPPVPRPAAPVVTPNENSAPDRNAANQPSKTERPPLTAEQQRAVRELQNPGTQGSPVADPAQRRPNRPAPTADTDSPADNAKPDRQAAEQAAKAANEARQQRQAAAQAERQAAQQKAAQKANEQASREQEARQREQANRQKEQADRATLAREQALQERRQQAANEAQKANREAARQQQAEQDQAQQNQRQRAAQQREAQPQPRESKPADEPRKESRGKAKPTPTDDNADGNPRAQRPN